MLARHPLISSCFSWNHGRRGCLGPEEEKRRMQMKWSLQTQMKWSASMRSGMTQSPTGCMLPDVRKHAEQIIKDEPVWKKNKRDNNTLWCYHFSKRERKKKKEAMSGWGACWWRHYYAHLDSREHFHLTTARRESNERATREHARNKKRPTQLQKKNNLLSVASIHFHSKRQ